MSVPFETAALEITEERDRLRAELDRIKAAIQVLADEINTDCDCGSYRTEILAVLTGGTASAMPDD